MIPKLWNDLDDAIRADAISANNYLDWSLRVKKGNKELINTRCGKSGGRLERGWKMEILKAH